jgi:Transposase DNA-binding
METPGQPGLDFGEMHFGSAQLGDRRRTRRLVDTANRLLRHPGGTLPDKLQDPAALKGLYRLMNADGVTHASVLEPHQEHVLKRMRSCARPVLILHDDTELDYTGKASLVGLGQIGNGSGRGYLCHNSLAVVPGSREVLGLVHQILHRRPDVPEGETRAQRRHKADRETRLWSRGCEGIGCAPSQALWVDVSDRASDLFEYLSFEHARGGHYVVRSRHDRRIELGEGGGCSSLHEYARGLCPLGEKTIEVPARDGRKPRRVRLRVAAGPVTMRPPTNPRGQHGSACLTTWVVYAGEIDPPKGSKPVEWILLTNVAVEDVAQTHERIEWYTCRWIIEEYHKAQKTGCGIELPQFTTVERLEPIIALLSVVAVYLLQLRTVARDSDADQRPVRELIADDYVRVLSAWRYKTVRPLTIREFFLALARLGGHQNRRRDHPPGWLILWRGWMKLEYMVIGANTFANARCG